MSLTSPHRLTGASLSLLQYLLVPFQKYSTNSSANYFPLLSLCRNVLHLKSFTSHLIVNGLFPPDADFLNQCFHLGALNLALSTFNQIEKPNLYLQNLFIRSLCDYGLFEDVLLVYRRCQFLGCPSDNYTFPFVLKACSALCSVSTGKAIHCKVWRSGLGSNVFVQTGLVDFYSKTGEMENARLVHDKIPQPDLVSWNALISGYSLQGLYNEVYEVFQEISLMGLKPNVSTLASMLPVCSRTGNFHLGISIHGFALKTGYLMDENLVPAFLSIYADGGNISIARDIFDSLPKKNVAIWNAMISAYTREQKADQAFLLFREMLEDDVQPNEVTFVSIIPSCESFGSVCGMCLHACVLVKGYENEISVATVLISMYAKLENLNLAESLFYQMPQRNVLTWNSIISGYVHNMHWGASLATFREMQFGGFVPDVVSIVTVLSSCSKLGAALPGKSVHAFSVKRWLNLDVSVSNALLVFYSDCHDMISAVNLFHKMTTINVISWNTLISGFAHNGEAKTAIRILHKMHQNGLNMDHITLISILPCFREAEDLAQGMVIQGYTIKRGFASDVTLANALISMYVNCEQLTAGKLLLEKLPNRNVISWNALLTGYRHQNLQNEVMHLFDQMIKEDQKPNYVTLLNILPACYTLMQGKSIHAYAARTIFLAETPLVSALMQMYARFGDINSCLLLFQRGEKSNTSLWNAIISVHVQLNNAEAAISFFCELLQAEIRPDYITVLSLTSACIQLNKSNLSNSIMAYIIKKGFDKDVAVSNALIDLYARSGHIEFARMIFENIYQKDALSWSVMINGYALHGTGETALALLSHMRFLGFRPDDITYVSILSACSHTGLLEEARTAFNSMVEDGILPRMEHYACMIDLLGRTGNLAEAFEILKSSPHKPSINILDSLLGSCLVHGNIEVGENIGQLLLELNPETSGPYIVLYKLYAAAGRWRDADRVRSEMERKQVSKLPGFSLLDESGASL